MEARLSCGSRALRTRAMKILFFFFQAEDGIRDLIVTGVQTCALPISTAQNRQRPTTSAGPALLRALLHPEVHSSRPGDLPDEKCVRLQKLCRPSVSLLNQTQPGPARALLLA